MKCLPRHYLCNYTWLKSTRVCLRKRLKRYTCGSVFHKFVCSEARVVQLLSSTYSTYLVHIAAAICGATVMMVFHANQIINENFKIYGGWSRSHL